MGGIDVALVLTNHLCLEVDHPPRCLVLFLTLFQSVNELLFCSSKSTQFVSFTPFVFESECKGTAFFHTSQIFSWKIFENMQFLCFMLRFCWQLSNTKSVFSNKHLYLALVRAWWNALDFLKNISVRNQAHLGIDWSTCGDWLKRFMGLSEAHLWIYWSFPLDSTSCRRFVIDLPSLRHCDGEGSPC